MSPNAAAIRELRSMPRLADREPRNIFHEGFVVMSDLAPKKTNIPGERPILESFFLTDRIGEI